MRSKPNVRKTRPKFRVRRAGLRDLAVLVHQRRGMWLHMGLTDVTLLDPADRAYARWFKVQFKRGNIIAWVVEASDGRVAGGGCLWLRPAQPNPHSKCLVEPYLFSMYTEPEFRRRGAASKVLNAAVEWSRRNGYSRLRLHASKMGRKLYLRHGFTRGWEMRLDLGDSE